MKKKKTKNCYDFFIRQGLDFGFTDDQLDFLWDYFYLAAVAPETFTHDDNYKKNTNHHAKS